MYIADNCNIYSPKSHRSDLVPSCSRENVCDTALLASLGGIMREKLIR